MLIHDLQRVLREAGLLNTTANLWQRYEKAVQIPAVRAIFDLHTPIITDLSGILGVAKQGQVWAVRMDLNTGVPNHKKFVVAGLILRGVLLGRIPKPEVTTFIDGGSFNSASAVKFFAERLGMRGMYIMSYLFPKHIIELLRSDNFEVIQPEHRAVFDHKREREFYDFLRNRMKDKAFAHDKFCLWHAKYGGKVGYVFGKEIAESVSSIPLDCTVSCLGAGATLEGVQIALQDWFKSKGLTAPRILVGEHELSPLFSKILPLLEIPRDAIPAPVENIRLIQVPQLPHLVIGPHYDEINPLLSAKSIARIDGIIHYSENDWQAAQEHLFRHGISVGNSSAANVSAAWRLASQGRKVMTVIFEPLRKFLLEDATL